MDAISGTFRKLAIHKQGRQSPSPPMKGSPPNGHLHDHRHHTPPHAQHSPPLDYPTHHTPFHTPPYEHATPYPSHSHATAQGHPGEPSGHRLRILCLHGYGGSASTLSSQIGSLSTTLAPYADLIFMDAPSIKHGDYGWWHARSQHYGAEVVYEGWDRTRQGLIEEFDREGPFDGVLGFSQGAILTAVLCGLNAGPHGQITAATPFKFDFAIMVGGFTARDAQLSKLFDRHELYTIPSLHVYGMRDGVVSPEASQALAEMFQHPTVVTHSGGHVIPSGSEARRGWEAFLRRHFEGQNGPGHGQQSKHHAVSYDTPHHTSARAIHPPQSQTANHHVHHSIDHPHHQSNGHAATHAHSHISSHKHTAPPAVTHNANYEDIHEDATARPLALPHDLHNSTAQHTPTITTRFTLPRAPIEMKLWPSGANPA